jgi:hypothetical protein
MPELPIVLAASTLPSPITKPIPPLYPDWNLISIPYMTPLDVSGSANCVEAFKKETFYYFNSLQQKWESVNWKGLKGGKAYWVRWKTSTCTISITGAVAAEVIDIPPLKKGYNLIGTPYGGVDISTKLGTCTGKIVLKDGKYAMEWDASNKCWVPTNILGEGRGYWIEASADCTLG